MTTQKKQPSHNFLYNKETTINDIPPVQLDSLPKMKQVLAIEDEEKKCLEEGMMVESQDVPLNHTNKRGLRGVNIAAKVEEELMFSSR